MRRLDAPKALAIGGAIVLAAHAAILGQGSWSRSGAPTATLELTERELAMPLTREKDDTGLELTLVTTDRLPEAVKLAALWRRIELPEFELPWLDAAKLRELGFDPDAVAADPADRRRCDAGLEVRIIVALHKPVRWLLCLKAVQIADELYRQTGRRLFPLREVFPNLISDAAQLSLLEKIILKR